MAIIAEFNLIAFVVMLAQLMILKVLQDRRYHARFKALNKRLTNPDNDSTAL